jgi:uncharacterized membrane protein
MKISNGFYFLFAVLAISIGLYPLKYILMDAQSGFMNGKNQELITDIIWKINFYIHIIFGGIALIIGWSQFSKKLRLKHIQWHRVIGKIYVISVLLSALSGIYIGFFAMGGIIAATGFVSLGFIWFYTTLKAYLDIRTKNIFEHEKMMIYSYAACFTAVTLRLWLPFLKIVFNDFETAYQVVAWWAWVPNLVVAYYIISKKK